MQVETSTIPLTVTAAHCCLLALAGVRPNGTSGSARQTCLRTREVMSPNTRIPQEASETRRETRAYPTAEHGWLTEQRSSHGPPLAPPSPTTLPAFSCLPRNSLFLPPSLLSFLFLFVVVLAFLPIPSQHPVVFFLFKVSPFSPPSRLPLQLPLTILLFFISPLVIFIAEKSSATFCRILALRSKLYPLPLFLYWSPNDIPTNWTNSRYHFVIFCFSVF